MKKIFVLSAVLGFFLFAQIGFASNNVQEELARVEKIAKEKSDEAKNLKIAEKAVRVFTAFVKISGEKFCSNGRLEIKYGRYGGIAMQVEVVAYNQVVFRANFANSSYPDVEIYKPDSKWLAMLESFYQQALEKETRDKIEDLKSRYDIK